MGAKDNIIEGEVDRSATRAVVRPAERPAPTPPAPPPSAGHSSPLDLPARQFSAALERRGTNRKALIAWVRSELVENVDFGRVETKRGLSKPSLWKAGAEKICGMLGVNAEFPTLADYERMIIAGIEPDQLLIRCELKNAAGEVVASGAGARSVQADNGDLNKALKMCLKSAMIDATLRLGGLSEVFTQDIEDMPRERLEDRGATQQGDPRAAAQQSSVPSGKHRGMPWADVPGDYLEWVVANLQPSALRKGAEAELERRKGDLLDLQRSAQEDDDAAQADEDAAQAHDEQERYDERNPPEIPY